MLKKYIFNAFVPANGVGTPQPVADYEQIIIALTVTTAPTTGTLKFQGSISDPNKVAVAA